MSGRVLPGRPGAPGLGIGRVLIVATGAGGSALPVAPPADPSVEVERLRAAFEAAATELEALARDTGTRAGAEVGAIFEAQALFARDPGLVDPAIDLVRAGEPATVAIDRVAAEQADVLAGVDDEIIRARAADLRDVGRRVVDLLVGRPRPELHHRDGSPAILAADDLEPSLVAAIRPELVAGLAFAGGAPTGHAAIVARALGIPLALGLGGAVLEPGLDGREAAVDGTTGRLLVEPDPAELAELRRAGEPAAADGDASAAGVANPHGVAVEANVGSVGEAEAAARAAADGIGLVRTELLFLGRTTPPGLAEQRGLYARIAGAMGGRRVVFRTLDVGGDKPAGFEPSGHEQNPALGVRGIRLGLRRPELLDSQLRALLEATADGTLDVLLPMVATLAEVRAARVALDAARAAATNDGAAVATTVRLGVMIEVPAAALTADLLAREVDFFSIGTNDLVQYTLAADRTNADLADLASPLQPAVLRLVDAVCRAAAAADRPVAVCGEAAADRLAAPLLVGLGVGELSVTPRAIPATRAILARLDLDAARSAAREALAAPTLADVVAIAERLAG